MDPAMAGCTEGTSRRTPLAQVPADFWSSDSHRLCNVDRYHADGRSRDLGTRASRLRACQCGGLVGDNPSGGSQGTGTSRVRTSTDPLVAVLRFLSPRP